MNFDDLPQAEQDRLKEERREKIREEARCVLRKGQDITALCRMLKINQTTLNEWERKDEEFRFIVGKIREGSIEKKTSNQYLIEMPIEEKFNPEEHPNKVYELFKKGSTPAQVRAALSINRKTIDRWRSQYPIFDHYYSLGYDASQSFWEKLLFQGMTGEIQGFNASIATFLMKNIFKDDYQDNKNININETIKNMTDSEIEQRIDAKLHSLKLIHEPIEGEFEENG
jgi:transposase-like protein